MKNSVTRQHGGRHSRKSNTDHKYVKNSRVNKPITEKKLANLVEDILYIFHVLCFMMVLPL